MTELVLYGAGYPNTVKLVHAINAGNAAWRILGFVDDTPEKQGTCFMGYPILGTREKIPALRGDGALFFNNVFSTMDNRQSVSEILARHECPLATLVHPSVNTEYCLVGPGSILSDGVIVGANVTIGANVALRERAFVSHDCIIQDNVFLGPGTIVLGHVCVRSGAYLGAGSTVREHSTIGGHSIIGAGAVVVTDVPPRTVVMGVPARPAKE